MNLCKKNYNIFIFTVHCNMIYVVSENRHLGSVGGGGSFGKPALGLIRFILFKNWIMFFYSWDKKICRTWMQSSFSRSWIVFYLTLISGGQEMTVIGTIFGSCPGTVTSLTVMMTTMLTIIWDPVVMVDGLPYSKGVSAWFGCLLHSLYTHNLCWASAKKAQGLPRHSIAVVPELCFFISQKVFFSVMKISLPVVITLKKI